MKYLLGNRQVSYSNVSLQNQSCVRIGKGFYNPDLFFALLHLLFCHPYRNLSKWQSNAAPY